MLWFIPCWNSQRNKVSRLINKLKKTYFNEKLPKENNIKDYWNYCKPYFTSKGICNDDRIILVENDQILDKDSDISETFNNYFVNITKDLGIFDWADDSSDCSNIFTRMSSFSNHPSLFDSGQISKFPLVLNLNSLVLIKS